jgi:hypothetical protein
VNRCATQNQAPPLAAAMRTAEETRQAASLHGQLPKQKSILKTRMLFR